MSDKDLTKLRRLAAFLVEMGPEELDNPGLTAMDMAHEVLDLVDHIVHLRRGIELLGFDLAEIDAEVEQDDQSAASRQVVPPPTYAHPRLTRPTPVVKVITEADIRDNAAVVAHYENKYGLPSERMREAPEFAGMQCSEEHPEWDEWAQAWATFGWMNPSWPLGPVRYE